jgi:predicted choloylglycine hydrolase
MQASHSSPSNFTFQVVSEATPGARLKSVFDRHWDAYQNWFLKDGIESRQTYLNGLRAMKKYMPELVPIYEKVVELVGGTDIQARFLSFYCPPAYLAGCSQAVWPGNEPMLVRNYDYAPALCDGVILHTHWNDQSVLGMSDGLLGLLDGINQAGLAVSPTFVRPRIVGDGFGVPLIIRYVLEFCKTAQEAAEAFKAIPCHMAYNVTVVDRAGKHITAHLSPDKGAEITDTPVATNHQNKVEWHQHARATATVERERFLLQRLTLHNEPAERFIGAFLKPPLYSTAYARGFGTLYTAVYWPKRGVAEYRWPGETWVHTVGQAEEGHRTIVFPQ